MNKFKVGDKVICVSDNFPYVKSINSDKPVLIRKPELGDVLIVAEIHTDYLRFQQYDTPIACNWWIYANFGKYKKIKKQIKALMNTVNELIQ